MSQELEDRLAIMDVLFRWGQALDHDASLWDDVFLPDAILDHPTWDAGRQVHHDQRNTRTAAEMGEKVIKPMRERGTVGQHLVSNFLIAISGDTATCRSDARVFAAMPVGDSGAVETTDRLFTLDDRLVRTRHGWRISHRQVTVRYHQTRIESAYSQ